MTKGVVASKETNNRLVGYFFAALISFALVVPLAYGGQDKIFGKVKVSEDPAEKLVLVLDGKSSVPVIVPKNPAPFVTEAAKDLVKYIKLISGAKLKIIEGVPNDMPESAIWLGYQPKLKDALPEADLAFKYPEEIIFAANEKHLAVVGRDILAGDKWIEHGTSCAVYTFIEDCLEVRWLWPAPFGEDIIEHKTIAFSPFEYRFHPVIRKRHLWPRWMKDWYRYQRILYYSYPFRAGHSYTNWWEKYGKDHPDWFALRGGENGYRTPPLWGGVPKPSAIKLCISNPGVSEQWLKNAEEKLKKDPSLIILGATPNDGDGFCTCEKCKAMDHPDGGKGVLTERYVKYWNNLAREIKKRFPDREVDVGAYAYGYYRKPPVAEKLEPNIALGYVGHFPLASKAFSKVEKDQWKEWADLATKMVFRPNLFHSSGGFDSLPNVPLSQLVKDMKFLAENKCVGYEVDTLPNAWSVQGPMYYLMAQLAYDPLQDGEAVIKDYFQRGFGPVSEEVEGYFRLMEKATSDLLEKLWLESGRVFGDKGPLFLEIFGDSKLLAESEKLLDAAAKKTAGGPEKYIKRVEYIRYGFEYIKLQLRLLKVMQKVKDSQGSDRAAVKEALEIHDQRLKVVKGGPRYALRLPRYREKERKELEDYLSGKAGKAVTLAPSQWKLVFSDNFNRKELGDKWKVRDGQWNIEDGALVTNGGMLISSGKYSGLQKLEFKASATADSMGVISDISPIIHANEKGRGYMMQFGGYKNTVNRITRLGKWQTQTTRHIITPGKIHHIVAELDGNKMRLTVDGVKVLEREDKNPLLDDEHQQIAIYIYAGKVKISDVKLYTSEPVEVKKEQNTGVDPDAPM